MSPEQVLSLKHFTPVEWTHPELVDYSAAVFLDQLREAYGMPLTLTSDARTPEENATARGSSPTSLHLLGRAFDIRWPGNDAQAWAFLRAFFLALGWKPPMTEKSVELELVHGSTDQHVHLGIFPDGRPSRLIVSAD